MTELPYGGHTDPNSGFAAGVATSEERARLDDADGTTSRRQATTRLMMQHRAATGVTWKELAGWTGWHHGQASGVLSVLHKAGRIARLTERRDRCFIYVLPEYVNGRDTQPQGRPTQPDDGLAVALIQAEAAILRVEMLLDDYESEGFGTVPLARVREALNGG